MNQAREFGALVRREREKRGFGLRSFAEKVGVSATYMSMLERGRNASPPSEARVAAIANLLDQNSDELLALAGRVPKDVTEIIKRMPREVPSIVRALVSLNSHQLQWVKELVVRPDRVSAIIGIYPEMLSVEWPSDLPTVFDPTDRT